MDRRHEGVPAAGANRREPGTLPTASRQVQQRQGLVVAWYVASCRSEKDFLDRCGESILCFRLEEVSTESLMRRMIFVPLAAVAVLALLSPLATACTCIPPSDVYTSYAASDAVFLGEVIAISSDPTPPFYNRRVTLRV